MAKKQDISIAVIEEKVGKIETWIKEADTNHFPTIEKRFDSLDRKLAYWSGGITATISIIQYLLK